MAREKKDPQSMSFLDHLEELRWHLIRSTIAVVIVATVAFIFIEFIFTKIIFALRDPNFISYQALCAVSKSIGMSKGCLQEMPFSFLNSEMAGQFSAAIWTSITTGFVVAFPYILYEVWKFISPALHDNERKYSRGFIITCSLLFFIGITFGYYIIAPLSVNFLATFSVSDVVENKIKIGSYISLVRASVIACGFIFELPIIIYFLTKVGLVTPEILRTYRKFAMVGVLILSAIITPPDIASQVIVAIPVLLLYEVSIFISKIVIKRQEKRLRKTNKPISS